MSVNDLKEYAKSQIKPEQIDDVKRRGYVEIECDPDTENKIADNSIDTVEEKMRLMKEGVKEITQSETEIDINLLGFEGQFKKLNQIGAQDVGKLVRVRGLVNATGIIKPMFTEAVFVCRKCQVTITMPQQDPFKLIPPIECNERIGRFKCGSTKFDLDLERSKYLDTRKVSIQETPEDVSGQIPAWKNVLITKKSLLNRVKCGDYVHVIGVVKVRVRTGEESRFGETYIEANNIIVKRKELEVSELSKEDIEKIIGLSQQPNVYEELVYNVAPSLHGLSLEKEAVLWALVGGVNKNLGDINRRDCIHVLLVGDPSVGKSQLLKAVSNLAPSGIYSSGKGTSSAGLTAAVIKEEKGDWLIFAGVMVLADKGIACIDEIDKMNPDDRVAMHEAMEQQTVTVNKANIHVTLSARTTVISAANPILGRYDQNKTIADNIKNLPATLLSRFDLIFVIVDTVEKEKDELLVNHVLGDGEVYPRIDRTLLKNYIIYAKHFNPILTDEAKAVIKKFYLESRTRQSPNDPIPITARQLESLMRGAQAHAKLLFKDKVDTSDAEAAIRLLSESLRQTCKFQTSEADSSRVESPLTKGGKEVLMIDILVTSGGELKEEEWREICSEKGISKDEFAKILMALVRTERILQRGYSGMYPIWAKV